MVNNPPTRTLIGEKLQLKKGNICSERGRLMGNARYPKGRPWNISPV